MTALSIESLLIKYNTLTGTAETKKNYRDQGWLTFLAPIHQTPSQRNALLFTTCMHDSEVSLLAGMLLSQCLIKTISTDTPLIRGQGNTVNPSISDHPKCQAWVVAYSRWSIVRVDHSGSKFCLFCTL